MADRVYDNTGPEPLIGSEMFEQLGIFLADHPHSDPGDGRKECPTCGKWVWMVTHSCKGVRVVPDPQPSVPQED